MMNNSKTNAVAQQLNLVIIHPKTDNLNRNKPISDRVENITKHYHNKNKSFDIL